MQTALTRQQISENDCFADDAAEYAEEIDTLLSSVPFGGQPLRNLQFADDLGGSEELQQLTERQKKTAAGYGMEISFDKSKILVNSIKPRPPTNI